MADLPAGVRPASWRGIAFDARAVSRTAGRRVVVREHPQGDAPTTRDMGRAARRWSLDAFIVGPDAHARKAAIIAACEQAGPGTLVHPTDGVLTVRLAEPATVAESSDALEAVEISLSFVEAGEAIAPAPVAASQAELFAASARANFAEFYAAHVTVAGTARAVQRALSADIVTRANALLDIAAFMGADSDEIEAYRTALDAVSGGASVLAADSALLAETVGLALATLTGEADRKRQSDALATIWRESRDAVAGTATVDVDALANRRELDRLWYGTALSLACESAAAAEYASYDEATEARDTYGDLLAELRLEVTDAAAYADLADLTAAMAEAITSDAVDLPRVRDVSVEYPTPALVLADRLYADPSRATEITERNGIVDPSSVAGALRVLGR